ncbi:hypothetical protein SECTIM467_91 [Brevibacillus phage SecTim467]|uniref:Uncharacterized protein n=2 Tax=Jenstvirus jenst TaxID=1982225 RepID=A0A0K2CPE8_9CAUD|nr:hypothetical protein AVV11_gp105 [Brevibacillus phage Jenst]ALA07215.1 hypothetical protein JENST_86 [Brevibacillus phage Jenst]ALA07434.1 hypothetical protein SECTIM467_91 [Brevibacillus phage SecTim467]
MQPINKTFNAMIQGSDLVSLPDDTDLNKSVPFMQYNRATRRAAIKEAKRTQKHLKNRSRN